MFERFTESARRAVVLAQEEARALKHEYIGTEHILLGILREEKSLGAQVLESLDVRVEHVRAQVIRMVGTGEQDPSSQLPFTPGAKRILELALREALTLGHGHIGTEHMLLGLAREHDGVADRILLDCEASPDKIRQAVIRKVGATTRQDPDTMRAQRTEDDPRQTAAGSASRLPDPDDVSDAELDDLIESRVHEEQALADRRRMLHDELDLLRAARDARRRGFPERES